MKKPTPCCVVLIIIIYVSTCNYIWVENWVISPFKRIEIEQCMYVWHNKNQTPFVNLLKFKTHEK